MGADPQGIAAALRRIVSRLEAGCDQSEFDTFRCPVCGAPLVLVVDRPFREHRKAAVVCWQDLTHFRPEFASEASAKTPDVQPAWWEAYYETDPSEYDAW
jgi:hypothetical protein